MAPVFMKYVENGAGRGWSIEAHLSAGLDLAVEGVLHCAHPAQLLLHGLGVLPASRPLLLQQLAHITLG